MKKVKLFGPLDFNRHSSGTGGYGDLSQKRIWLKVCTDLTQPILGDANVARQKDLSPTSHC